jgi:hypothetical protein
MTSDSRWVAVSTSTKSSTATAKSISENQRQVSEPMEDNQSRFESYGGSDVHGSRVRTFPGDVFRTAVYHCLASQGNFLYHPSP